jgi:amino acid adenylation domain-containing protein
MDLSIHILNNNHLNLVDLLRSKAVDKPDHICYTYLVGGGKEELRLTYRQIDQKARTIAAKLRQICATGDRAILVYPGGLEFIPAFFGCLYAGVIAVPCFPPRDKRDLSTLGLIAADSGSRLVLTNQFLSVIAQGQSEQFPELNNFTWLATDQLDNVVYESDLKEPAIPGGKIACIMYTSGSTRVPTGVMISHQNILESMVSVTHDLGFSSEDVLLSWVSYFHVMGLMLSILGPIYEDIPVILFPPESFSERPMRWLQAVSDYKATISLGPNFAYEICAAMSTPQERSTLDLSCWRLAGTGAEAIRYETIDRFSDTFSGCGFHREAFYSGYGLTEATVLVSGSHISSESGVLEIQRSAMNENRVVEASENGKDRIRIVSCGRAYHHQEVRIVHPKKLIPCAPDEIGEVWISGPNVAGGYWKKPIETKDVFHGYLSKTGEGPFLRTGDLGFIKNGELFITGRYKDLIVLRGRNYYPSDIEVCAENSHSHIHPSGCAAFSIPNNGEEQLVIVLEPNRGLDVVDVEAIAKGVRLAVAQEHHLPVNAVVVIEPGSIPRTGIGKIQRFRCRDDYLSSRLATIGVSYLTDIREHKANKNQLMSLPRAPLEYELAEIFKEVLKIDSIKIHENFFALGGNSLLATQVASRARERFLIDLPAQVLFEYPTVASIASYIDSIFHQADSSILPSIQVADRSQPLSLSFSQERLWLIYQLQPDSTAYNIPTAIQIKSKLNIPILEQAFNLLIQLHEILRTRFYFDGHRPYQQVMPSLSINIQCIDLRDVPRDRQQERLIELIKQESGKSFDLSQLPLFRTYVYRLPDDESILFINIHHIITDAWSMSVFFQELYKIYQTLALDHPLQVQPPTIQYADFAEWQRKWLAGAILDSELVYWRKQLEGVSTLELPTDHKRPPVQTYRGSLISIPLPQAVYDALNLLSQKAGVSFFMIALAAFYVLLFRYSGQVDIPVGVPIANRRWLHVEKLIGTLVNTLVLRINLDGDPSFLELLQRVKDVALAAYAHQDLPFERLVAELKPERDPSHTPFFQVMFNLLNIPAPTFEELGYKQSELPDIYLEIDQGGAQFDMTLTIVDTPDQRQVILNYNSDLFEKDTVNRMLGHYMNLLEVVVQTPELKIFKLPFLSSSERSLLLDKWNDTQVDYPLYLNTSRCFEAQVEKTPQALAVVDNDTRLTFEQLNQKANQLAHYLRELGVGNEMMVGVCLNRSTDLFVVLMGILKAGGAYLPLDPTYPPDRLAFMLRDSATPFLITQRHLAENLSFQNTHLIILDEERHWIDQKSTANLTDHPKGDNLAYVIYTSGSTGLPKGVMGLHRGVLNRFHWMWERYPFSAGEICCQKTTLNFVDSIWEIFGPLLRGIPVLVIPEEIVRDIELLIHILGKQHVTRFVLVPSLLKTMLEIYPKIGSLLPDLKFWVSSGEALSPDLVKAFHELLPGRTLLNLYGSSEVAADCTYYETTHPDTHTGVPIGRPISNMRVYLLDAHRQLVPIGVAGEICIGGVGVARGYLNRPELDADRFIADPFTKEPGARLFRTGDLGRYLPDGNIEYLGRNDRRVKIHGSRVELNEIERNLKDSPGISSVAVIARLDATGNNTLVAYVVPRPKIAINLLDLRSYLRQKLPEFMIPATIVILDHLPLLPNGKIDLKALSYSDSSSMEMNEYVAPTTQIEKELVQIWENLLGVRPIGITQSFFDLGGHSLLAVSLFAQVNRHFGKHISLNTIFEDPTVKHLAKKITTQPDEAIWHSLVPIQPYGKKPPIFFVHPFGGDVTGFNVWAQHLGKDQPFFGLRAKGLDGIQKPLSRIEEMAALYLTELRLVQPNGPYYLGGYCIGGVIAFEMAQQLYRQGEQVALLAIVNQPPPNSGYYIIKLSPGFIFAFLRNLPYWFIDFLQLRYREIVTRLKLKLAVFKAGMSKRFNHLFKRTEIESSRVTDDTIKIQVSQYPEYQREFITSYFHKFLEALAHYQPQVYPGHIILFRTPRQPLFCSFDHTLCWNKLAGCGIDVVVVPGSNTTITRDPYALEFVKQLKSKLNAAQNGNLSPNKSDAGFQQMGRMPIP